ncbi:hypothetical protein FACS1894186_2980 [Alphaproteobacteria bacterium]|nr:hypothetical protein FACS1894186_2980 [Alphaproteobacteria bacterium]
MAGGKPLLIEVPNTLRQKAPLLKHGGVDAAALLRAEQAVAELGKGYLEWARADAAALEAMTARLEASGDPKALAEIFLLAHDMKGQGTTFGYKTVTLAADSLCRYLERHEGEATPEVLAATRVHVDALTLILAEQLADEASPRTAALLAGLNKVAAIPA